MLPFQLFASISVFEFYSPFLYSTIFGLLILSGFYFFLQGPELGVLPLSEFIHGGLDFDVSSIEPSLLLFFLHGIAPILDFVGLDITR